MPKVYCDHPRPWLRAFWDRAYQRERHRALGDGRLQPDARGLPVRPAGPLRLRPGAEDQRGRGERARRPSAPLPQRRAGHPDRRPRPDRGQLDDDRDRRLPRLALDRRLLLGGDGHRLLPHLPRRVPRLGRAEALLLRDAGRRPPLHRRQHLPAGDRERRSSPAPTSCRSASPTSRRSTRCCCSAPRCSIVFADLLRDLLGGAEGPHALARGLAGGRLRHGRRRHRQLGSSPSTSPTSPASRASARRSASSSSPCSGSTRSAWRCWPGR